MTEQKSQEEKNGLTLADVGVHDYTEAQWNLMSPREKLISYFDIRKLDYPERRIDARMNWFDNLSPEQRALDVTDIILGRLSYGSVKDIFKIPRTSEGWSDIKNSGLSLREQKEVKSIKERLASFYEGKDITWDEALSAVEAAAPRGKKGKEGIDLFLNRSFGMMGTPYFTNNFYYNFINLPNKREKISPIIRELGTLIEQNDYNGPRLNLASLESVDEMLNWNGQHAIFPYYVLLRRQGFSTEDLM